MYAKVTEGFKPVCAHTVLCAEKKMEFCTFWALSQSYCMLFTHKTYQHDPQSSLIDHKHNDCHATTMAKIVEEFVRHSISTTR